jgi:hypothetical protein
MANVLPRTLSALVLITLWLAPEATRAKSSDEDLTLALSAQAVAASGTSSDGLEDADKSGAVLGADLSWDRVDGADRFGVDASSTYYAFTDGGRDDRWSNRIAGSYGRDVARHLNLSVRGDFASQLATLESSSTDQTQLRGIVTFEQGRSRARISGGWRWRDYRDGTASDGGLVAIDYRLPVAKSQSLRIGGQYDAIDAEVSRRSYHRYTVEGGYTFKPLPRLTASLGLRYRDWTYSGRLVGTERQKDHSLSPTLDLSYRLARNFSVDFGGEYIRRRSNDAQFNDHVRRLTIGLTKRFRLID